MAKQSKKSRFIDEYMKDFNGTRAAKAAGYAEASAHVTASQLLKDPKVSSCIESRKAARSQRLELSVDEIVEEMKQLGFEKDWSMDSKGLAQKFNALKFLYEHVKTTKEDNAQSFGDLIRKINEMPDDE